MNSKTNDTNIGRLYIIIAALLWSMGGFLIKNIDANPAFIALGRSAIAGVVLFPFIRFKKLKNIKKLALLSLSYSICLTTFVISTKLTAAANAIAIQYCAPLFLFLGLWITTKKLNKQKIVPMFLILLGIAAFLMEPISGSSMSGNLLAVVSGIAFAFVIYLFGFDYGISGIGLTALLNILIVPFAALIVPWGSAPYPTDLTSLICLSILGLVQIGISYVFFYAGRKRVSSIDASILSLVEPVLNPVWVFILIGEKPSYYAVVGMVLILSAQILNTFLEYRENKKIKLHSNFVS
ncbi:MAG: DMT family transporter [Eubacteriales bacterium]